MIKVVSKDGKNREVLCLPLGYLNGWLAGIELSRVNSQIKPLLKHYQLECFDVLYNHFTPKVASQCPNIINTEQQQAIIPNIKQVNITKPFILNSISISKYHVTKICQLLNLMRL